MKEILPEPTSAMVENETAAIQGLFDRFVITTYGRFDLVLTGGKGSTVTDAAGRQYLDMGGGIAVNCLGHAHPAIVETVTKQAHRLSHVSNLYYYSEQGKLAQKLVSLIGPGKCFFCNSGAEANEGLYKIARRFGDAEGRFEIITANNSFHGRTLAGIAATGQDKVKAGFGPAVPGFRHVPFNDLAAVENAISPATVAVLIEGIQGEGGLTPADAEYLIGLRKLCDERNLLLMMDEVQAGHFRTGRYQSWQRILENHPCGEQFLPDAVSMAKSLGGGLPVGAFWVRDKHADLLGPGSHGTTYGGNPFVSAIALAIIETIERENLTANISKLEGYFTGEFDRLKTTYPGVVQGSRGLGLMLGLILDSAAPGFAKSEKPASIQFVTRAQREGLLVIPAGANVVRLLPAYNLLPSDAETAVHRIESVIKEFAS